MGNIFKKVNNEYSSIFKDYSIKLRLKNGWKLNYDKKSYYEENKGDIDSKRENFKEDIKQTQAYYVYYQLNKIKYELINYLSEEQLRDFYLILRKNGININSYNNSIHAIFPFSFISPVQQVKTLRKSTKKASTCVSSLT